MSKKPDYKIVIKYGSNRKYRIFLYQKVFFFFWYWVEQHLSDYACNIHQLRDRWARTFEVPKERIIDKTEN